MSTDNLPNLNESVLTGLDFFEKNKPQRLRLKQKSLSFVVGSVNAYHTGQMLFADQQVLLADESNFRRLLKTYQPLLKNKSLTEAVVISASGEKDSVWEIREAKKHGLTTTLLTCSPESTAAKLADRVITFKKSSEPYSYNFSTYFGIIISQTGENPAAIKALIKAAGKRLPLKNLPKFSFFSFILPDRYKPIVDMLNVKDDELFGPYSSLRAYTEGEARHAKFICPSAKELVISFCPNSYFGLPANRWEVALPAKQNFGLVLAWSYYLVGFIQAAKPDYFKKNIARYCQAGPRAYGETKPFPLIVK